MDNGEALSDGNLTGNPQWPYFNDDKALSGKNTFQDSQEEYNPFKDPFEAFDTKRAKRSVPLKIYI